MLCLHYVLFILFVNFCNSAKRRDESFIWNEPFRIELNWINDTLAHFILTDFDLIQFK